MKSLSLRLVALFASAWGIGRAESPASTGEPAAIRERLPFDDGWRFQKGDPPGVEGSLSYEQIKPWLLPGRSSYLAADASATSTPGGAAPDAAFAQTSFDDRSWRAVTLPHDWGIEGPFDLNFPGETGKLPWWGVAWYRKRFTVAAADAGRRIFFDVDGAMSYATVWLNGHFVGGWPYGYASWQIDLTPYLKMGGENVLAVRLDNPPDSSRWYPGGGIYRNVWLVKTEPIHVAQWGNFVLTPVVTAESALVEVRTTLQNDGSSPADPQVSTALFELRDQQSVGGPLAESLPAAVPRPIAPGRQGFVSQTLSLPRPKRWSVGRPALYVAVTTIRLSGTVVDRVETVFGARTIAFTPDHGFLLNGERVQIQGVCDHSDLGALGTAINVRALERQLEILRQMGCNAIRTSHNPPAPELLDLCDRMGFLVLDEAFDCWAIGKTKNDYQRLFPDWHEADLRAMVRRDRNHPSVVLWSIGNEIREQAVSDGWKLAGRLAGIVREEDRTRFVTAGCNYAESGYNGFQVALDVLGYNYKPEEYAKFRRSAPLVPVVSTESASSTSSRGEYFFPVSDDQSRGLENFQVSSYDLSAPSWAMRAEREFAGLDRAPFVAGEFVWAGFDYLGEPTPYNADATNLLNYATAAERARAASELSAVEKFRPPSRSSYFGIIDLAGFKKDRFYLYQAQWRPDFPMAHILPHWNWPERIGQITPVHVYTSGDEAELFLNGRSLGRKKREPLQYRLRWDDVIYQPGVLRVVAYKRGVRWAEDVQKTTGPAHRLLLGPDRANLRADGRDLSFVTLTVADDGGLLVPRSKNLIHFSIDGPGEIVATDNGDPTCLQLFQSPERPAFNGLALVIVRTESGRPGIITLRAESAGLASTEAVLRSD